MRIGLALMAGAVLLTGCSRASHDTAVEQAWVRLPAVDDRPAAGYFTLRGGPTDTTLTRVSTTVAIRAELHRSTTQGTMTTMQPLTSVPVPANGTVTFAPGGNHVMLFDLDPSVVSGSTVPLTLDFADGKRLTASAKVVAAGDPAPGTQ